MHVKHLSKKRKGCPKDRYFFTQKQLMFYRHLEDNMNSRIKRGEETKGSYVGIACGCGCGCWPQDIKNDTILDTKRSDS
jgi:hypothetical protein